jgi:hypothetical protein
MMNRIFFLLASAAICTVTAYLMLDRRRLKNGSKTDCTHGVYSNWFEKIMERTASEKTFKQQFRMKMSTFDKLVELVTLR